MLNKKLLICLMLSSLFAATVSAGSKVRSNDEGVKKYNKEQKGKHKKRNHFKKMLSRLDLTEEQKSQVKVLKESNREAMQADRETHKSLKKGMRQLLRQETIDEVGVKSLSAQISEIKAKRLIQKVKFRKQVIALLTDDQRAKMEEMKERRKMKKRQKKSY